MSLQFVKQDILRGLAALPLLLLCACAPAEVPPAETPTPPAPTESSAPEPTAMLDLPDGTVYLDGKEYHYNPDSASHDTYEIDVGDGEHMFRLEAVSAGLWANEFCRDLTLSFYEGEDRRPVQVIETDVGEWPRYFELYVEDIDFDGCMDFYYLWSKGTHNRYYAYYVWDKETEQFIYDPYGLSELENPTFNLEQKAVVSWYRTSIWGGKQSFYRYIDGRLTCVRVCGYPYEHDPESATLYVKDLVDGELKTVFEVTHDSDTEFTEEEEAEYFRWFDLSYHGPHTLELDIRDGAHTFWVEITPRESEEEGIPITVSVYDSEEKSTLWQSWEDVCYRPGFEMIGLEGQDVDFDGNMDLVYSSWLAASTWGMNYWIWDAEQEKFIHDPYGLEELSKPEFDPERQVITTENHSGGYRTEEHYRYLSGKLTCVRRRSIRPEKEPGYATLTVEDYRNGTLREVYRAEKVEDNGVEYPATEEFRKWKDLDYHGEETP